MLQIYVKISEKRYLSLMEINHAIFQGSFTKTEGPEGNAPVEFAFIGRSNVGKSSLINMLCRTKGLAHTSSTPGKTQCINKFLMNGQWIITDLPGYGFAKISKTIRARLEVMIQNYINRTPQMVLLFVLLDCRHPLQKIDLDFLMKLGSWQIPFALVLTKADKLSKTALQKQTNSFIEALSIYWEPLLPLFAVSSKTASGRKELLEYMESVLEENR